MGCPTFLRLAVKATLLDFWVLGAGYHNYFMVLVAFFCGIPCV
jgi:hypothetical protein